MTSYCCACLYMVYTIYRWMGYFILPCMPVYAIYYIDMYVLCSYSEVHERFYGLDLKEMIVMEPWSSLD